MNIKFLSNIIFKYIVLIRINWWCLFNFINFI